MEKRGVIIAIEGIDGAGKTTVAKFIRDKLEEMGLKVRLLKEPTNGVYGKRIREILSSGNKLNQKVLVDLYAKDRKINVFNNILPAIEKGEIVILDRYVISSLAYQSVDGMTYEEILEANKFAPPPDLVIILDVEEETAIDRLSRSNKRVDSFEKREFLKKVRERYFDLFKKLRKFKGWENTEIYLINANRDIEVVKDEVLKKVLDFLKRIDVI